jgi:hypothetical protein
MTEKIKTEQELFIETIENNLKNNFHLLLDDKKIDKTTEYELLGSLCYYIGIGIWDFPKNVNNNTKETNEKLISSLNDRLSRINIKLESVNSVIKKYKYIDVNYLEEINQINKDLINKTLPSEDSFLLSPLVKNCILTLIVPVSYVKDLDKIKSAKLSELTYRHLLMLNNFIYDESVEVTNRTFEDLRNLQLIDKYNKAIKKGTEYYNKQKYSIMFFDLILSMKEYLEYFNDKDFIDTLDIIKDSDIVKLELKSVDNNDKDIEDENLFKTEPLKAVLSIIIEEKKLGITLDDIKSDEQIYELLKDSDSLKISEDIVMYLKQTNQVGLKFKFDDLNLDNFKSHIIDDLKEVSEKLKSKLTLYMEDLPSTIKTRVIDKVNYAIQSLIIDGSEKKAYLYQQLLENGIETYKHLQQMIGLIEQCKVRFGESLKYRELVEYINENKSIQNKFELIEEIDKLNDKAYYFQTLKSMF